MAPSFSLTPKTTTIGGRSIVITRCAATEALDLQLALARLLGGADTVAAAAAGSGNFGSALEMGLLGMVSGIASKLSHAELLRLMNIVFKYVQIDGQPVGDINSTFANRPRDIWEVFVAAVAHNLGPLADWLRERFQSQNQTTASPGSRL